MAAKKKVVRAAAPVAASAKLPKGIAVYNGRYYFNLYIGSFETVEETVAIRERALEFKASLKDVAPKAVVAAAKPAPAPAAEPAPAAKKKKSVAKKKVAASAGATA